MTRISFDLDEFKEFCDQFLEMHLERGGCGESSTYEGLLFCFEKCLFYYEVRTNPWDSNEKIRQTKALQGRIDEHESEKENAAPRPPDPNRHRTGFDEQQIIDAAPNTRNLSRVEGQRVSHTPASADSSPVATLPARSQVEERDGKAAEPPGCSAPTGVCIRLKNGYCTDPPCVWNKKREAKNLADYFCEMQGGSDDREPCTPDCEYLQPPHRKYTTPWDCHLLSKREGVETEDKERDGR